ncbi:MAG: signal peptide peptidase SppA [Gammaproteobacteria bacterium]|nr:signal peptide peptidase SppA [Gammaproteobacteria bacterium]
MTVRGRQAGSARRSAFVRKFFSGLFRGLDGLRKVLHLLLLLVIFGFIFGAMGASGPKAPSDAALVLRPEGEIVEQLSGDPLELAIAEARGLGRDETRLRDLTDAMRAAKDDARIKALVIDFDRMGGAGQPTLDEFARAITDFRKSGKKVIAQANAYGRDTYYVAAHADEVYLDPMGLVVIEGYERYRNYYKQALDKLGVDVNVFRVGTYKSAVEPWLRSDMSPEDREASQAFVNSLWETYVAAVSKARGLAPEAVLSYVNTLSPAVQAAKGDGAKVALQAKLVTALKTPREVEQRVMQLAAKDDDKDTYRGVSVNEYLKVARAEDRLGKPAEQRVAVLVGSGEIVDGGGMGGVISGDKMSDLVRKARLDKAVKALVLRVDSPGGSVLASEQIYREVQAFKATGRPVVVSMGDLAASGGYYISAPADEIWASPATITGSIGIFGLFPTAPRTFDKLGIATDGVGTTPLSGELRLDRPVGPAAATLLQATIEHGYEEFLGRVSKGRNKTRDQVDAIAQGRVWAGRDAKRLGLVDGLGSLDDAVNAAAKRAKLKDGEWSRDYLEPDKSFAQQLLSSVQVWGARTLLKGVSLGDGGVDLQALAALRAARSEFTPVEREVLRMRAGAVPGRLYAHCFCTPY